MSHHIRQLLAGITILVALTSHAVSGTRDIDADGVVDVDDLLQVIWNYGPCESDSCAADIDEDGSVTVYDLLEVIAHFGEVQAANADAPADTALHGTRIVIQNARAADRGLLADLGVANDGWILSGSAVDARRHMELEEFLEAGEMSVWGRLGPYLDNHPDLDPATTEDIILDIEHPVHPRDFGRYLDESDELYDPALFNDIIDAFRLRISVAQSAFPNARIGLYGVTTPHPSGEADMGTEVVRMMGYEAAGERGLYDEVDFLATVLYARFGDSDHYNSRLAQYTQLGIDHTSLLRRTDQSALDIMPMLSLTVFNGSSAHDGEPVSIEDLSLQIATLRDLDVHEWMFWNGSDLVSGTETSIFDRFNDLLTAVEAGSEGGNDNNMD